MREKRAAGPGPGPRRGAVRPTARGIAVTATGFLILAAAMVLGRQDLLTAGVVLVAVPVAAMLTVRLAAPQVHAALRAQPAAVPVGADAILAIEFGDGGHAGRPAPPWRYAVPAGLRDAGPADAGTVRGLQAGAAPVPAGLLRRRVCAERRGVYRLGPLLLDVAGPFGLARQRVRAGRPARLVVVPAPAEVAWPSAMQADAQDSVRQMPRGFGGPLDGVLARPYQRGDPIRRVQWRATARFGELMVRQEERPRRARVRLVVDTRARSERHGGKKAAYAYDDESFELTVRVMASVARLCAATRRDLTVVEVGARQLAGEKPGSGHAHYGPAAAGSMLPTELAGLCPAGTEPARDRLDAAARRPGGDDAVIVVLRPGGDDLVAALPAPGRAPGAAVIVPTGRVDAARRARWRAAGWEVIDPVEAPGAAMAS